MTFISISVDISSDFFFIFHKPIEVRWQQLFNLLVHVAPEFVRQGFVVNLNGFAVY